MFILRIYNFYTVLHMAYFISTFPIPKVLDIGGGVASMLLSSTNTTIHYHYFLLLPIHFKDTCTAIILLLFKN